jgi:hypothetical protein
MPGRKTIPWGDICYVALRNCFLHEATLDLKFGLNIFVYIKCDLVHFHNTKCKRSIVLLRISHLFIKHGAHGVFQLDYKKNWTYD